MEKKSIILLLVALMVCILPMQGKRRTVVENDSMGNKKRVIELRDTAYEGKSVTDTLSVMTYNGTSAGNDAPWKSQNTMNWKGFFDSLPDNSFLEKLIELTAVILIFGMPVIIVFIVLYFRYRNRREKYRLAEAALASGQQLPPNILKKVEAKDLRSKGISNICFGLGLFIFLWSFTKSFGIGSIGLLVLFTGIGQIIIHRTQDPKE
ncbi:MAG: DUF6249 domain-containing protein [Mediterranea sp.]|jgi:hypothetical protein|nr:DUF6249 domain-containing protein [Mediterranea sp.]